MGNSNSSTSQNALDTLKEVIPVPVITSQKALFAPNFTVSATTENGCRCDCCCLKCHCCDQ